MDRWPDAWELTVTISDDDDYPVPPQKADAFLRRVVELAEDMDLVVAGGISPLDEKGHPTSLEAP